MTALSSIAIAGAAGCARQRAFWRPVAKELCNDGLENALGYCGVTDKSCRRASPADEIPIRRSRQAADIAFALAHRAQNADGKSIDYCVAAASAYGLYDRDQLPGVPDRGVEIFHRSAIEK
ncbi:MAG: hypothetical protein HOP13_12335 [Alphaproteobacteria bacterium]|nr:hypothetical protein [Alphaproteobacteria bacterium]